VSYFSPALVGTATGVAKRTPIGGSRSGAAARPLGAMRKLSRVGGGIGGAHGWQHGIFNSSVKSMAGWLFTSSAIW